MFSRLSKKIFPNVIAEVCAHRFNVELFRGDLSAVTFNFYLQQDIIYLGAFSTALATLAKRFTKAEHQNKFAQYAATVKNFEVAVHKDYMQANKSLTFYPQLKSIPAIDGYIQHFTDCVQNESLAAAVASVVPCYWLYSQLGLKMQLTSCEKNPYHYWAVTYSDKDFIATTDSVIAIMDELSAEVKCPLLEEKIIAAFKKSIDYEMGFWDAVYQPALSLGIDYELKLKPHALASCAQNSMRK